MDPLDVFLEALLPILRRRGARSGYLIGSRARGDAPAESDIGVIIVAESDRPAVERFKDYLPAILAPGIAVDLFVYTPAEFDHMLAEERPFLVRALEDAKVIHEG
jgi:predicted nucleotidyltransferase